jgi:ParB family chromosome partitioning protein
MQRLWKKIVNQGLSVRQTETAVQDLVREHEEKPAGERVKTTKSVPPKPAFLNQVEVELLAKLNTKVRLKTKSHDTGTIEISYYSQEDLERILDILLDEHRSLES